MAVQTQIQVRRGTASSWTSTNPTLAAGEIGFETDTGKFKIGTGSSVWTGLPYAGGQATSTTYQYVATAGQTTFSGADANGNTLAYTAGTVQVYLNGALLVNATDYTASNGTSVVLTSGAVVDDRLTVIAYTTFTISTDIPASNLSAKGSLVTASAASTPANLSVGSDGDVLMANSSVSTGLSYTPSFGFTAGKNKIINGDFGVWQRGTSFTLTTSTNTYTADRLRVHSAFSAGTSTLTQQSFTYGTAPVSGYEGTYFARLTAGSTPTYFDMFQLVENVRTFAGQTATFSFWAKASVSTPLTILAQQYFGAGGSALVNTTTTGTIGTSWTRYSFTFSIPSIAGKTIATGNYLNIGFYTTNTPGSSQTFDTWGWQLEAGSTATAFQTATGTIQGELAACQRYYYRNTATGNAYTNFYQGSNVGTTEGTFIIQLPVSLRVVPTALDYSTIQLTNNLGQDYTISAGSISTQSGSVTAKIIFTTTGLSSGAIIFVRANNSTSAYIGLSAEL